jgi:cytochrome c oxidase subunit IV
MDHSAEDIKKHVRTYIIVFVALLVLTVVTVAVSYIHLPSILGRTVVALIVAGTKATLVAMVFMHLKNERPFIYLSLALTAVFFVLLFALPMWTEGDHIVNTRPDKWSAGMEVPHAPEHSPEAAH